MGSSVTQVKILKHDTKAKRKREDTDSGYSDIDDTVEANVITPLADIFRTNNYEIKPVMSALLKSEHFFDTLSMGCGIKSPFDYTIGFCRQFEIAFPKKETDYQNSFNHTDILASFSGTMMQDIGEPPNVAGWPAYYQEPQFYEIWINSDTLPKRLLLANALLYVGVAKGGFTLKLDPLAFAAKIPNASDPNKLLDNMLTLLLARPAESSVKPILKAALLKNQSQDYYWTDAWNAYVANNNDAANKKYCAEQLTAVIAYIFNLAEFQLN